MSKANVFADVLSSQSSFHVAQSLDTPSTSSAPSVAGNDYSTATTSTSQPSAGQPATHPNVNDSGAWLVPVSGGRKGKQRLVADQRIINKASERFYILTFAGSNGLTLLLLYGRNRAASLLAADHLSVMFPDVDTPFSDAEDVVRRLLPYHVLQQPAKDLQDVIFDPSGKGKARAVRKNEADVEGMVFSYLLVASRVTDGHHRHQIDDRILQNAPFAPPTIQTSENKVFTGTEHQFLAPGRAFSNPV